MLPGLIHAPMIGGGGPVLTYIGRVFTASELTTYTHTGVNIGVAAADRLVVLVVCNSVSLTANRSIVSATIGGVSCTLVANAHANANFSNNTAIFSLLVTSGTTATITVTNSGAVANNGIDVFTITGLTSTTATDTLAVASTTSTTTLSGGIDVLSGGCMIGGRSTFTNATCAWTNLTEVSDAMIDTTDNTSMSSAMSQLMAAETNRTITAVTTPGNDRISMAVASWR